MKKVIVTEILSLTLKKSQTSEYVKFTFISLLPDEIKAVKVGQNVLKNSIFKAGLAAPSIILISWICLHF